MKDGWVMKGIKVRRQRNCGSKRIHNVCVCVWS